MENEKYSLSITILILVGIFSLWCFWYLPINEKEYLSMLDKRLERAKAILAKISTSSLKKQEEIFNAKYYIIFEDKVNIPSLSTSAGFIDVPLNLSKEELKQNILHAAKNLKRKKNTTTAIIFAYRQDDKLHQVYTAGKCIYTSDLDFNLDIAEVYYKTKKIYTAATEAIINKDNVILYSKKYFEPEDIITRLEAGTEIMTIEHYRSFTTTDFVDIYKVLVWPHKNGKRQYLGWIVDNNVIEVIQKKE